MKTKDKIVALLKENAELSGSKIAERLNITRQAVNKQLKQLIKAGIITKTGSTRGARYRISDKKEKRNRKIKKIILLKNASEDKVFEEISLLLNLKKELPRNSFEIFRYAFTEMLNNAIEHSKSEKCEITVENDQVEIRFSIRDFGIGIFSSVASKFELSGEEEAVVEIAKGKRTTAPESHTGEGIFFTSKAGDILRLRSHKITVTFDNRRKDVFFGTNRNLIGTEVIFILNKNTKKKLPALFEKYAPKEFDYKFEKTRVLIKLLQSEYISRSEAKRLLAGLDKFREIVLDFKDVKSIGQGFADEVFRVFSSQNPGVRIIPENLDKELEKMLKHVMKR